MSLHHCLIDNSVSAGGGYEASIGNLKGSNSMFNLTLSSPPKESGNEPGNQLCAKARNSTVRKSSSDLPLFRSTSSSRKLKAARRKTGGKQEKNPANQSSKIVKVSVGTAAWSTSESPVFVIATRKLLLRPTITSLAIVMLNQPELLNRKSKKNL